jgi:hypothetical protein
MWKACAIVLLGIAAAEPVGAAGTPIDTDAARQVFAEFRSLCTPANTDLWGKELCGPLMLVGPDRAIITNRPAAGLDPIGGGLFRGTLPAATPVANTAVEWAGIRWTQLVWPITADGANRRVLLAHEAFHRIQPAIGIETVEADNAHLDSYEGRLWLRLEANALADALESEGAWREPARDALLFRATRLRAFPKADASECELIRNEGLAEYTGVKAGGGAAAREIAVERLRSAVERPSFVRALGYIVGPAYGLLLDRTSDHWRAGARAGGCPPAMLETAIGKSGGVARERARRYDFATVEAEEQRRAQEHREALARYARMFVTGPTLLVPFQDMRISFNPNRLNAFPPLGTVYDTGRVQDIWGSVVADGDFLVSTDRKSMRLPGPVATEDGRVSGPGWSLTLAPGWTIRPGERSGDFVLARTGG